MRERSDDIRLWHYITRNISTATPTSCLFVDTETTGVPIEGNPNATLQVLRSWCSIYCRIEKGKIRGTMKVSGTTTDQFWSQVDALLHESRPLWLFAHNLGFDITVLKFWQELDSEHFTFNNIYKDRQGNVTETMRKGWSGFAVLDDPPVIIECRKYGTKKVLICNDTYNYFRCSVADLGESIGLPKLPMPEQSAPQDDWDTYCFRDVEIIQRAITGLMRFVKEHDLGMWKYTAPAQAMSAYRHRFMREKILVHGNADAIKLERDAYYGGRLECMYVGKIYAENYFWTFHGSPRPKMPDVIHYGPIYVLDVQSCYPAMMLWHNYPRSIKGVFLSPSKNDLRDLLGKYCVVARVNIITQTEPYPYHHDGRTDMCVGRFLTSLCGPELHYALDNNHIQSIGSIAVYDQADLFSEYVSTFWNLRQQFIEDGNSVNAAWCKLMLNSLAGKFGQRSRTWVPTSEVIAPLPWGNWSQRNAANGKTHCYRALAWAVQEEHERGESIDSCPAIAAYITSYAREYLRDLIRLAGNKNVYYVDTDCLHVNERGYCTLLAHGKVQDGQLGMLRLVGEYQSAEYRGLKDYTLDGNDTIAGVRHNAHVLGNRQYRQDKFQKLHSILSDIPPNGVRVDSVTIDRRGTQPRGRVQPDGTVLPMMIQ